MNNQNPEHSCLVTMSRDVFLAAQSKAMKERLNTNQMIEKALRDWCGFDKPIPNPRPYVITQIKEPEGG